MKRTRLLNLSKYLRIGVPPSSSGGFHDSFTCSARTFLVFPHFFIFLNCFHSMSSFSIFLILLIVFPHCPHLIRLESSRPAGNVQHVDVSRGFKIPSFTSETNLIEALVFLPVSLPNSQNRVPLAVNGLLGEELQADPWLWLNDCALPLPGDGRRRFPSKPDVVPSRRKEIINSS